MNPVPPRIRMRNGLAAGVTAGLPRVTEAAATPAAVVARKERRVISDMAANGSRTVPRRCKVPVKLRRPMKLVLFDIDGTLLTDCGASRDAFGDALRAVYDYG